MTGTKKSASSSSKKSSLSKNKKSPVSQITINGKHYKYSQRRKGYFCGSEALLYEVSADGRYVSVNVGDEVTKVYELLENGGLYLSGSVRSGVNDVAHSNAKTRGAEKVNGSLVLPGFPLKYVVQGLRQEAIQAGQYYKTWMHRFALESGLAWSTDDDLEARYGYIFERVEAERRVYEKVVPAEKLFSHFKKRALASLNARIQKGEKLTSAEEKAYRLLQQGGVNSFYEFSVRTGVIEAMPPIDVYEFGGDSRSADSKKIQDLLKARCEASLALHYYLNVMDTSSDLPDLDMSSFNSSQAYTDMLVDGPKKMLDAYRDAVTDEEGMPMYSWCDLDNLPDSLPPSLKKSVDHANYVEVYQKPEIINAGRTLAFEYLFSIISRSRRWSDVSNFQADVISGAGSDRDAESAWRAGVPPVVFPEFYNGDLEKWCQDLQQSVTYEEKRKPEDMCLWDPLARLVINMTDRTDYSSMSSSHVRTIRGYYQQCETMKMAVSSLSNYRANMSNGNENNPSFRTYVAGVEIQGVVPYFHDRVPTVSANVISQGDDELLANFVDASGRGLHTSQTNKNVILTVSGFAPMGALSFGPAFVAGVALCEVVSLIYDEMEKWKVEKADRYLRSAILDLDKNIESAKKYRKEIVDDDRYQDIKKQVLAALEEKGINLLSEDETALYLYLKEGKLPEIKISSDGTLSVHEDLKKQVDTVVEKSNELLKLQIEAQMLSLCVNMYESQQLQKYERVNTDELTPYDQALNKKVSDQKEDRCHFKNEEAIGFDEFDFKNGQKLPKVLLDTSLLKKGNLSSNQRGEYFHDYKSAATRALVYTWAEDVFNRKADASFVQSSGNARRNVVTPYGSAMGGDHALFSSYSFSNVKTSTISRLEEKIKEGTITEDEKKLYTYLTARVQKEGEESRYNTAMQSARKFLNISDPQIDDMEVYRILLFTHAKNPTAGTASLIATVKQTTVEKITSFAELYECLDPRTAGSKFAGSSKEEYNFLQSVYLYVQGGDTLKYTGVSSKIFSLFPSRAERYEVAKAHGREDYVIQEFQAEEEILKSIVSILSEAPDAAMVCEKMGWQYTDGKIDLSSIQLEKDPNSGVEIIKNTDLLEQRCCAVLRAFEWCRHDQKHQRENQNSLESQTEKQRESTFEYNASVEPGKAASSDEAAINSPLVDLIFDENVKIEDIEAAIAAGANINETYDDDGTDPLFLAIGYNPKIVSDLIKMGAKVELMHLEEAIACAENNEYIAVLAKEGVSYPLEERQKVIVELINAGQFSLEDVARFNSKFALDMWYNASSSNISSLNKENIKKSFVTAIQKNNIALAETLMEKSSLSDLKKFYKCIIGQALSDYGTPEMLQAVIKKQNKLFRKEKLFSKTELINIEKKIKSRTNQVSSTVREEKPRTLPMSRKKKNTKTDLFFEYLNKTVAAKQKNGGNTLVSENKVTTQQVLNIPFEAISSCYWGDDGANIVAIDPETGLTSIHLAIQIGDVDLLKLLLNDPRITADFLQSRDNSSRKTALEYAKETKNRDIIALVQDAINEKDGAVFDHTKSQSASFVVREGNVTYLMDLIKKGRIDVKNTEDASGQTVLHWLAKNGRVDLLHEILNNSYSSVNLFDFTKTDKNRKNTLDLIPEGKNKVAFITACLEKELKEKKPNKNVVTELLEQLDEKVLEGLKNNNLIKNNKHVLELIDDQLIEIKSDQKRTALRSEQSPNMIAFLTDHSGQNITTVQGNDGVNISYTSLRGRV